MRKILICLLALTLAILPMLTFASCSNEGNDPAESTAGDTDSAPLTEDEQTDPSIETEIYRDPTVFLDPVGKSYDGTTDCYNGAYRFPTPICTAAGTSYYSIQEAMDALKQSSAEKPAISMPTGQDTGVCLSVNVPDDDRNYMIYYNMNNCDFVFNLGCTFDDGSGGYAYYSKLSVLDNNKNLDNCNVYIWAKTGNLEAGYYKMVLASNGDMNYTYERLGDVTDYWPGLPNGQTYNG